LGQPNVSLKPRERTRIPSSRDDWCTRPYPLRCKGLRTPREARKLVGAEMRGCSLQTPLYFAATPSAKLREGSLSGTQGWQLKAVRPLKKS